MTNKLHVYTGEGKGKTTAAMGLALRSLGHGNPVLVAQFMKKGNSGELKALKRFENARVETAPPIAGFTSRLTEEELKQTRLEQTAFALGLIDIIKEIKPRTVILDELGIALKLGLTDESVGLSLINTALEYGETVVTGRGVPDTIKEKADYLSEIKALKHPYETEGLTARKGVEW